MGIEYCIYLLNKGSLWRDKRVRSWDKVYKWFLVLRKCLWIVVGYLFKKIMFICDKCLNLEWD